MTGNNGLPQGWVQRRIGDIAKINYRDPEIRNLPDDLPVTFLPMAAVDAEQGVIAKPEIRPLSEVRKGFTPFKDGDVLFAKITPSMENGKAAIADGLKNGLGFGSTEFHAITLKGDLLPKWLFYFIRQHYFRMEAKASFRGTAGQLRVPKQFLENYEIPVPPLPEQERIVARIEETFTQLEAGVAELRNAKAQLKRYRAAVLKSAVEGELTREWREAHQGEVEPAEKLLARILSERREKWEADGGKGKYKEPAAPNMDDLPELPDGWVWANVDQLGEVTGGLTKHGSKRKSYPIEIPYLRVANVYANELLLDEVKTIQIKENELGRVLLTKGDLLVVEGNGSRDQIGRVALWDGSIDPCAHQNHLIKVRFNPVEIGAFVLYWLLSNGGRSQIMLVASSTSGLYTLSLSKVSALAVPLPPLAEQKRIIEKLERRLSVADEIEKELDGALVRAERLRGSVLKSAFEGRLV